MTEPRELTDHELDVVSGGLWGFVASVAAGVLGNACYDAINNHDGAGGFTKGGIADYVLSHMPR
jgi:hypothetical protein